ncbi:F-box/WD repeat-containing protein 5-like [Lampetra fluviatilis]
MSCDCPDETGHEEFFDCIDHLIDVRGHVVRMGLSPDHRLLYVSCRAWPEGCIISDPLNPPPIAQEMELRVYELGTARELKRTPRAQRSYTPTDECSFFHLHVSRHFIASGSEDHNGYIWDRHYSVRLARLPHDDCVSSVALSPVEQEMAVTASADHTLKVWRSARVARIMTQTRKSRLTTFSWLKS